MYYNIISYEIKIGDKFILRLSQFKNVQHKLTVISQPFKVNYELFKNIYSIKSSINCGIQ